MFKRLKRRAKADPVQPCEDLIFPRKGGRG